MANGEPNLASGSEVDQTDWTHYGTRASAVDLEEDCDDEGVDGSGTSRFARHVE